MTNEAHVLRSEMVAIQDERLKLFQVGIALLSALEMALYYIRRDMHDHLGLTVQQALPFERFIVGTAILTVIAGVFAMLTVAISKRYQFLRHQYEEKCTGDLPLAPRILWAKPLAILCYFSIPALDLGIRVWVTVVVGVH